MFWPLNICENLNKKKFFFFERNFRGGSFLRLFLYSCIFSFRFKAGNSLENFRSEKKTAKETNKKKSFVLESSYPFSQFDFRWPPRITSGNNGSRHWGFLFTIQTDVDFSQKRKEKKNILTGRRDAEINR